MQVSKAEIAYYLYKRAYPTSKELWEDIPIWIQRSWIRDAADLTKNQRQYYSRRIRKLCIQCKNVMTKPTARCPICSAKETIRMREKYGHKPWQPGSRGKKPKYEGEEHAAQICYDTIPVSI
jgi:hypothetical protein